MSSPTKFLILLTLSLVLLLTYAFLPSEWVQAVHLKQISLRDAELAATGLAEENLQDSVEIEKLPKEPTDTATQRILLFGDSMVGCVCYRLGQYAQANHHKLTSVAWFSSTTEVWAKTDTLQRFLQKTHPTHVFICLGSNELFYRDLDSREKNIRQILKKIGDIPVIWIGPPNWAKDYGFNNVLRKVMGPRAYYPSLNLTLERRSDGRHPTLKGGNIWMDKVVEWMNSGHSIHPFVLNTPAANTSNMHRIYTIAPPGSKDKKAPALNEEAEQLSTTETPQDAANAEGAEPENKGAEGAETAPPATHHDAEKAEGAEGA